jgi:hypothetical protein
MSTISATAKACAALLALAGLPSLAAESAASGSSTAEASTGSSGGSSRYEPFLSIGAQVRFQSSVPDLRDRRDPQTDLFGDPVARAGDPYRLLTYLFALDLTLARTPVHSAQLRLSMPFRSASGGSQASPYGSEFGGLQATALNRFFGRFSTQISYADRRSETFGLLSRHRELSVGAYFETLDTGATSGEGAKPAQFYLRVGPEFAFTQTLGVDERDAYGPQRGFSALIRLQTSDGLGFPIALGLETQFRRISAYKVAGKQEGGAGLLTLLPQIEYMVVPGLWVGATFQMPILRPEGREEAFPSPDLAGLYGNSAGLSLRSATF